MNDCLGEPSYVTERNASELVFIVIRGKGPICMTLPTVVQNNYKEARVNKVQVKGPIYEAEGKAKEVAGQVIGNKGLEQEGTIQNSRGKIHAAYGDLKKDIKKIIGNR